ncbi:acetyl-CoA synthetase-like protein [Aspergillus ibericus CBS 121593]|uniref:Acetyl-CoA synthetase-like protein n=1 Tax=Aspergillus ibericus CBS 121593 TaxID=1448316 RepID=A0A395GYK7_9EURO|nr:acetyl-CoA synthetase-like protein [Aspergillus ibericus CBS 121593]RAK99767.1 acetyl-CoA synthetase-like protein [Aspergillus ibericus CBS 121593]
MAACNGTESWVRGGEEFRGQRLLPDIVDYFAHEEPDRVFAAIPKSRNVADGFRDINMRMLATAVNHMAGWVDRAFDGVSKKTTLAYIGPPDLRYPILLLALMKCGWTAMFVSVQNTAIQNLGLLQEADVHGLLYADSECPVAESLQQFDPFMPVLQLPALAELLKSRAPPFHWAGSFSDLQDKRCLILHTSGTTGQPKLVNYTHGTLSCADRDTFLPVPEGRRAQNADQFNFSPPGRFYSPFPPHHLAGLHAYTLMPLFSHTAAFVMGPLSVPPSGSLLSAILQQQPQIRAIYAPPFMIEQWVLEPGAYDQARRLDFILFGGGALAPRVGHKLSRVTDVRQMYGSMETCHIQVLIPQPGEWEYLEFNKCEEYEMQAVGDGVYELVLHPNEKSRSHLSFAHNYPNVRTWRTKDLFMPHPTKPGLWRFHSRTEDIIMLENKLKVWPIPMETILRGNPHVVGALIVGNGRPEPILLVEPRQSSYTEMGKEDLLDAIWPSVVEANSVASDYAQIRRSRIILCPPQLGFFRTPKGTVMRKPTESLYIDLISAIFKEEDEESSGDEQEYSGDRTEVGMREDQLLAAT